MTRELTLTVHWSDRIQPLASGAVSPDGIDLTIDNEYPSSLFQRVARGEEIELTEMSLSTLTLWTARGDCPYVAIPAFPSRFFRHNNIFVNDDAGIDAPTDLRGKCVGIYTEYQMTMATTIRGFLQDEYDVVPEEIEWVTAREEKIPIDLPDGVEIRVRPPDEDLLSMLESGSIDALIGSYTRSDFGDDTRRLFENFQAREQEYYERTGLFPIMHTIVLHEDLYESAPWIAESIYEAMIESKRVAIDRQDRAGVLRSSLPWHVAHLEDTRDVMGENFWPYGYEANYDDVDTLTHYSSEQGLSDRRISPAELFVDELQGT